MHVYCLVNKANTTNVFWTKPPTDDIIIIGKLSAKVFEWPNHSQQSYVKNLVACLIIHPQESKVIW